MSGFTKFITFYSYKGGVGRTSSLVNSAIMRANEGNRVVLIDFDLEAPGISSYLSCLDPDYDFNRMGILEYLTTYLDHGEILEIKPTIAYDFSHVISKENGGGLWFVSSGDITSKNYAKNLERINWVDIFKEHKGDLLLKNFKKQIEIEFAADYVFIDSRTGITETGGICTKYLADTVVMLTSLNNQNIVGTSGIFKDIKGEGKKFIFVASNVPVGMPLSKDGLLLERYNAFEEAFQSPPDVVIYNYPSLSLSEELSVKMSVDFHNNNKGLLKNDPLQMSYKALSDKIEDMHNDTYLDLVDKAFDEMFYMRRGESRGDDFKRLQSRYSDRYLTKIVQGFYDYLGFFSSSSSRSDSELQKFISFVNKANKCTTKSVQKGLKNFKFMTTREVLENEDIEINSKIEKLVLDENMMFSLAMREVGNGRFEWATTFFEKEFVKNQSLENTYNYAFCLMKTNNRSYSKLFKDFIEKSRHHGGERDKASFANFKAAVGFAYEVLKDNESAVENYKNAILIAKGVNDDEIFSPFIYKELGPKDFIKELRLRTKLLSEK